MLGDSNGTPTRVICVGLGAIGTGLLDALVARADVDVVAAIDPARSGERLHGMEVLAAVGAANTPAADVAVLATGSSVPQVAQHAEALVEHGLHIVTSCEGFAYPWYSSPDAAAKLDDAARTHRRAVVGTGINPGFVMDALPVFALSVCVDPVNIRVRRRVNLDARRPQLREKVGVGVSYERWEQRRAAGEPLGHAGLVESAILCAVGAGWSVEGQRFTRDPLLAEGQVIGIHEIAEVSADRGRSVRLELIFECEGAEGDEVEVRGGAGMSMTLAGVNGDTGTVARLVHAVRNVGTLPPGLRLPIDLPAQFANGRAR